MHLYFHVKSNHLNSHYMYIQWINKGQSCSLLNMVTIPILQGIKRNRYLQCPENDDIRDLTKNVGNKLYIFKSKNYQTIKISSKHSNWFFKNFPSNPQKIRYYLLSGSRDFWFILKQLSCLGQRAT